MTKALAEKLVAEHGGKLHAADAIIKDCKNEDGSKPTRNAVAHWIRVALVGA
jgi:hypothetical protein